MKIYVMCDLEGVAGVINHRKQCWFDGDYYLQARRLATLELNALVEGALEGGATEIVAWDGHGGFPGGLDVELLHPECQMVMGTGDGGPEGLDDTFDAAMQLGLHAMAGTANGPLAHSFMMHLKRCELNGLELGEIGMNCLMASEAGVPTIFLAGDMAATEEARRLVPAMETVAVKFGLSQTGCISLAPAKARQLIREGARRAASRLPEIKPFLTTPPYTLRVEFKEEKHAEQSAANPKVKRINATTVESTGQRVNELCW